MGLSFLTVLAMRSDHLDAFFSESLIERIGVECLVSDKTLWLTMLSEKGAFQSRTNKGEFMR